MRLTKYEHACFTCEQDGKLLVVDPGGFTTDLGSPENVVAIVVTHDHGDHFDATALGALIGHNPEAIVLAPKSITDQLGDTLPNQTITAGDSVTIEPFDIKFSGGEHATIHTSLPTPENVAVLINQTVFYPGDSFTQPDHAAVVLALPVAAPWMKLSEAIDYYLAVKPKLAFPTHDAILSEGGRAMVDKMIDSFSQQAESRYQRITEPVDI